MSGLATLAFAATLVALMVWLLPHSFQRRDAVTLACCAFILGAVAGIRAGVGW